MFILCFVDAFVGTLLTIVFLPGRKGMILRFGSFWPPSTGNLSSNSIWNTRNSLNLMNMQRIWGTHFLTGWLKRESSRFYKSAVPTRNLANGRRSLPMIRNALSRWYGFSSPLCILPKLRQHWHSGIFTFQHYLRQIAHSPFFFILPHSLHYFSEFNY